MTLRQLLGKLGAKLDDCGRVGFYDEDPILDAKHWFIAVYRRLKDYGLYESSK